MILTLTCSVCGACKQIQGTQTVTSARKFAEAHRVKMGDTHIITATKIEVKKLFVLGIDNSPQQKLESQQVTD